MQPPRARFWAMMGGAAVLLLLAGGLALWATPRDAIAAPIPEGPVTALAAHPSASDELALATDAGLFRSEDRGATWQALPWPAEHGPITRLLFASESTDTLYAAGTAGLAVSQDGGQVWQTIDDLAGLPLSALASSPAYGAAYAAADGRLWRSEAATTAWTELATPPDAGDIYALAPHPASPHVLYAGGESGLYVSGDRGTSWHPIRQDGLQGPILWLAAGQAGDQTRLVAGNATHAWLSQDDGVTWVPLASAAWPDLSPEARGSLALWAALADEPLAPWPALASDERPLLAAVTKEDPYALYLGTSHTLYTLDGQGDWLDLGAQQVASAQIGNDALVGLASLSPVLAGAGVLLGIAAVATQVLGRSGARREPSPPIEHAENRWDDIIAEALLRHQRVTPDLLERIPAQARVRAMIRYVDAHRGQALDFRDHPPLIVPAHGDKLDRFIELWGALTAAPDSDEVAAAATLPLVEHLCELLGLELLERRARGPLAAYMVEAPALQLSLPPRLPILLIRKKSITRDDLPTIRALMSALQAVSFFALLIPVAESSDGTEPPNGLAGGMHAGAENLVALDYGALYSLHLAADPQAHLVQHILGQVDLSIVSPYVQSGPVPAQMFYGRDHEIKHIIRTLQDKSCAIVGGRKIGKTSVLNSVYHQLRQSGDLAPSYVDCHHVTTYQAFFQALSAACDVPVESATPDLLRRVVVRLRRRQENAGRTPVLLLDEVDQLLRHDLQQGAPLLSVFHALSQERVCRFCFCGERTLNGALRDANSPLRAFCSPLRLGYLQERDVRWIVQEPMREMGLSFEAPETTLQEIVALSGRHPNIVQAICQHLIERVSQRNERVIRADDLAWVRGSTEFRDLFFEISWGNATTLERLITVLMTEHGLFGPHQVRDALYAVGVTLHDSELKAALEGLLLTALLKEQGSQYTFATGAFARMLRETGLAEGFRESLLSRLREERG